MIAVSGSGVLAEQNVAYGRILDETATITDRYETGVINAEHAVREYFEDIPIMIAVARCESTFRHTGRDGTVLTGIVDSADTGVMQINTRYHGDVAASLGLDLTDIHDNMAYARYLYEKQGTQPWSASAPCWQKTLAYNG